jgi:hypothetical protein
MPVKLLNISYWPVLRDYTNIIRIALGGLYAKVNCMNLQDLKGLTMCKSPISTVGKGASALFLPPLRHRNVDIAFSIVCKYTSLSKTLNIQYPLSFHTLLDS